MFLVAAELGNQALGLGGGTAFGLRPTTPVNIKIAMQGGAQSDGADVETIKFFRENPDHPQARPGSWTRRLLDGMHGEGWSERMLNGETRGIPKV